MRIYDSMSVSQRMKLLRLALDADTKRLAPAIARRRRKKNGDRKEKSA